MTDLILCFCNLVRSTERERTEIIVVLKQLIQSDINETQHIKITQDKNH